MNCVLLNSPIYWKKDKNTENYLPPIGLGYIATRLSETGVKTEVIDCVKKHISVKSIINVLKKKRPQYIGSNIFTQNYDIVKHIFENSPTTSTLILGGQVVKHIYKDILNWNLNNYLILIIGEAELILPDIINSCCKEKPYYSMPKKSVYLVNNESCYLPTDLSDIRLNRSFLFDEIVVNHYGHNEASIITSRGCVYNCGFCGGARSLNKDVPIRIRSVDDIINEVFEISNTYEDIRSIRVLDDLFLMNRSSINRAICIFSMFPKLFWRGMAHVLTFKKSLDLLPNLKQSGCKELFIGIESGSDRIRKMIKKAGQVKDVLHIASEILRIGIDIKGYFIYGFPSEDVDDFKLTYELALELKNLSKKTLGSFRCSVFQFRPYHGTELYEEIKKSGIPIQEFKQNKRINRNKELSQFNFFAGNFCSANDDLLNEYILRTQMLSEV